MSNTVFGKEALSLRQFKEKKQAQKVFFIKAFSYYKDSTGKLVKEPRMFRDANGNPTTLQRVQLADKESNQPLAYISKAIVEELANGGHLLDGPVVFKEVTSTYPGKGELAGQEITRTDWYAMRPQEVEQFGTEEL